MALLPTLATAFLLSTSSAFAPGSLERKETRRARSSSLLQVGTTFEFTVDLNHASSPSGPVAVQQMSSTAGANANDAYWREADAKMPPIVMDAVVTEQTTPEASVSEWMVEPPSSDDAAVPASPASDGYFPFVPATDSSVEFASGLLGFALGLFVPGGGSLPLAAALSAVMNYASRKETGFAVRGVATAALAVANHLANANDMYDFVGREQRAFGSAIDAGIDQLRRNVNAEAANGIASAKGAASKAADDFWAFLSRDDVRKSGEDFMCAVGDAVEQTFDGVCEAATAFFGGSSKTQVA